MYDEKILKLAARAGSLADDLRNAFPLDDFESEDAQVRLNLAHEKLLTAESLLRACADPKKV